MCKEHSNTEYVENRKLNQLEIEQRKVFLKSKIRRLMVVLTGKCNLRCIMCERRAGDFTLPQDAIWQIAEFFPYLDTIMWQGGEVFVVDFFKELFQEASKFPQILQEINTNGLLISEKWADLIAKANTRLIISIDSTDRQTYEYIRRGAKFDNLIRNISLVKEARKRHNQVDTADIVNIVVMRSNYQKLDSFVDFAAQYGFHSLNFMRMLGNICPQENIFHLPDYQALSYLKEHMPKIIGRADTFGMNVTYDFGPFLSENETLLGDTNHLKGQKQLSCLMPWKSIFVDGSQKGEVYPECLCRIPVGNIFSNSLEEIWNNQKMQLYRQRILDDKLKDWCNPDCTDGLVNKDFLEKF